MENLGFDNIEPEKYREPGLLPPPSIFDTFHPGRDPVRERERFEEEFVFKQAREKKIKPPVPKRLALKKRPPLEFPRPKFVVPWPKRMLAEKGRREMRLERDRNFCDWESLASKLPRRPREANIDLDKMDFPSPDVSRMKVMPQKPSITPSEAQELPYPYRPDTLQLLDKEPRSGIFINETLLRETDIEDLDSFNMLYAKMGRASKMEPADEGVHVLAQKKKRRRRKKKSKTGVPAESESAPGDGHLDTIEEVTDEFDNLAEDEGGDEGQLTRMFRRKVSQASKATSLNSKELVGFPQREEFGALDQTPYINRIIQKFRRDSEMERYKPPRRKIKRGTLESHSFTNIRKATNKHFYYGVIAGTIHQGDDNFPESSRNLQGICMPIAAYCFSIIRHPNKWTEFLMDEILETGDRLYHDSIGLLHIHDQNKELRPRDLYKYCYVDTKKLHFQVYEPELAGFLRSSDKRIYNLQKALKIYFKRHRACILQTFGLDVAIWKDKHFYLFDAKPRAKDLWPDSHGTAILANLYQVSDVASVLLDRGELGNWPFIISKLSVIKVSEKDEIEEPEGVNNERSDYNILSDKKAVILGSFDLADLCFEFTRNKQAIAIAAVSLVYSRITPPSAWHRRTVDKIMVIGNQLYVECAQEEEGNEMKVENLPAVFTIGPYVVNVLLYTQVYADSMFKKSQCMLEKCLTRFFERSTMAIVEIGRFAIAAWFQRNLYFCFDPYSRNNEGLACRNGSACVSMHTTIPALVETITSNFDDKEALFYIHPLKVLKIHRDPTQTHVFPKTTTMDDIPCETFRNFKMRKSARKAIEKPVTVDYSQCAIMKLLAGEEPNASIIEVGSNVDSLTPDQLPPMMHRSQLKTQTQPGEFEKVVDLDSPSLSDTQIEPERPPFEKEELEEDLGAFDLTQEELEMQEGGEGEGKKGKGEGEEGGKGEGEGGGGDESFLASTQYAQVREASLEAQRKSAEVNTNITTALLPLPRKILRPTDLKGRLGIKRMIETARRRQDFYRTPADLVDPEVTQSEELAKETNFKNLPDDSQIIRGRYNISNYGLDLEYMAPFVCMMAGAVAKKYSLASWSPDVVEYVLSSGKKVYEASKVRYDQVPRLTVPKVTLGTSDYCVEVDYLLDLEMKHRVVELALERLLFPNFRCGVFVTPSYSCAVFHKNRLFYMFDPFGCNEVGLGEGPTNEGAACLMRFKTVHDMVRRIAHNKAKRDEGEPYKFARFVLSSCVTTFIPPVPYPKKTQKIKKPPKYYASEGEEGHVTTDDEKETTVVPDKENLAGYQYKSGGTFTIHGTVALKGRTYIDHYELKEGHFVCLCACLMLVDYPVTKWDTRRVNYVIEQGRHVFEHAKNLSKSTKRTIKNVLIHKHFFDVIVRQIPIPDWKQNKNLDSGIDSVMYKRKYIIIEFPNSSYVLHNYRGFYHVFDPYTCLSNGKPDKSENGYACWTKFSTLDEAKKRLKSNVVQGGESYTFYTFEITSVRKAPKKLVIGPRMAEFEKWKLKRDDELGRPFHEKESWLKQEPIMWSRMRSRNLKGKERTLRCDKKWNNWDIEIPRDLYTITGTVHQNSAKFASNSRGKQTLCNMVLALAHLTVYPLCEWAAPILDSILTTGDAYFKQCITGITAEDYELGIRELKPNFEVFPYKFQLSIQPVVDGTIFTMRAQQFNLYKALRYFFESYERRFGICCAVKLESKRYVAFGKTKEGEYLMYDCQAHGPPMFPIGTGASYILRCLSLKRLVHIMVVTLRGGDFFLYEVQVGDMKAVNEQDKK